MNTNQKSIVPLFLTVLIDMIGVGIIIPLMAPILEDPNSGIISHNISDFWRHTIYGVIVSAYPVFQFFGAPILGTLSDQIGRKKVLIWSLMGTVVGYGITGIGVLIGNLPLIFIGRSLDGLTGGNISIANSAIADISDKHDRPKYYGLIGVAFGVGFILGPVIGGFMSDSSVSKLFSLATPFWFASVLSLVNVIFVQLFFQETLKIFKQVNVNLLAGFSNLVKAFKQSKIEELLLVVFLFTAGFTFFTQVFQLYLVEHFGFGQKEIGIFYGLSGIWMILVQGLLMPAISRKFEPNLVVKAGLIGLAISIVAILFPQNSMWLYLIMPFVAFFNGIARPNVSTLIANETSSDMQGEVQGIVQSVTSVALSITPVIGSALYSWGAFIPNIFGGILLLCAYWVLVLKDTKKGEIN